MKLLVVAVGQRVPTWAQTAWDDYAKRFPPELKLELKAIKTEPRAGGKTAAQLMAAERQRIEAAIPKGTHTVVLDERGTPLTTQALAARLTDWGIGWARARASVLYLSVFTENARAQAFYRRYGFYDVGRNAFRVGNHIDEDRFFRLDL